MSGGNNNGAPAPDVETYNAFVHSALVADIALVAIGGERRAPGPATHTRFVLQAGYQVEDDAIHYRFDATGHLTDETDMDYGQVSASFVVTLSTPTIPDEACIELFGGQSAAIMVHPYLREALAGTAQRLGFAGVLLPVAKVGPAEADPTPQSRRGGRTDSR